MIRFTIPYPASREAMTAWNRRYSLNAYWSGKTYHARNRDAREIHELTVLCMRRAKIPRKILDVPGDDSRKWVRKVSHEFWDGKEILVEVYDGTETDQRK